MHEYSIVQALLDRVEAEARGRGAAVVTAVRVRIGELSGVEPDLLKSAYELCIEGSLCAGSKIVIQAVPARWACTRCDRPVARGEILRCPDCAQPARLVEGDEILLERIEMEVA